MSEKEKPEEKEMESEKDSIEGTEAQPIDELEALQAELETACALADENMDG